MNDRMSKSDGFGIGELGLIPETTAQDEMDAAEINAQQALTWAQICQRKATCVECDAHISARVYSSGTMGCCVMCEDHWVAYHWRRLRGSVPNIQPTFDNVMAAIRAAAEREAKRAKNCAVCGQSAAWNSGAGQDLCHRHWDSY